MAWTTPRTWVSTEVVTASIMNTHVRDNFDETAPAKATAAGRLIVSSGSNTVAERAFNEANTAASETTSSTSYTDLATTGPAVTTTTDTRALLFWGAQMSNDTGGGLNSMSYAITGATAQSASDARAVRAESSATGDVYRAFSADLVFGLTAGSNTFTAKYRVSTGTGTFLNRQLIVFPM